MIFYMAADRGGEVNVSQRRVSVLAVLIDIFFLEGGFLGGVL